MDVIKKLERIMQKSLKYVNMKDFSNHPHINKTILEKVIILECGGEDRTIKKYLNLLTLFDYIQLGNKSYYKIRKIPSTLENYTEDKEGLVM